MRSFLCCLPYHEGLPTALLETMNYGLSCIVSDIPANKNAELSDNRFFEAGSVTSLCKKLEIFVTSFSNEK